MAALKERMMKRKWAFLSGGGLLIVLVVGLLAALNRTDATGGVGEADLFEVQEGPLTISVSQSGTIRALEQEILTSDVEGSTTIIYLIPEGTLVEEGDLLVELDASQLEDNLVDGEIRVQNAEAAFVQARENLEVVKNQSEADISLAQLNYDFAVEDLDQYENGTLPKEINDAKAEIALAEANLEKANEELTWAERLYEQKYISKTERDSARLTQQQREISFESSKASLNLLQNFSSKRQMAQLKSDIDQTRMTLERTKLRASADIIQAEAKLKAAEAEFKQEQSKYEKLQRQIENTKIYAPRSGLVVYATSARASWRGNQEPLDEGQTVRERQELIYLPTADTMVAVVQVHESNLKKLRLGLPVIVTVDALQGKSFMGKVMKIAPLPDAQSMFMNPDLKVYPTEILIDGSNPDLRTGMSCQAEIIVDQFDMATYVPVQSVIRVGGETVAYVKKGSDLVPTPVEIGLDNNRMIQIKSGLEKGQVVSLAPPLSEASAAQEAGHSENSGVNMDEVRSSLEESKRLDAVRPQRPTGMNNGMGPDGAAGMPAGGMEDMRQRFQNMSQEERDAMRQRFENMSQEERDAMRQRMGGGAGGAGGAGRTGRGPRGGGAGADGAGGGGGGGMAPGGGGSPRGGSPMGGAR
jgi:HlyD family secretion protein